MSEEEVMRPAFAERFSTLFDKAERVYLRVLRAIILIIATGLIIYAGWLGASSLYKIARSADSVQEKVATVAADELIDAEMPASKEADAPGEGKPRIDPAHRAYYSDFVGRYYRLFRTKFEPFRQKEDKQLTKDGFDDSFIDSSDRLDRISKGELVFEQDKADLETLLATMTEAADRPATQQRLQKYRSAKKVRVAKKVQRTRTDYRDGWNPYSTSCANWYLSPYGCAERRAVEVPYTQTVYALEFPKGTQSHTQIFRAFQDRYYSLLIERREANAREAENERASILEGNVMGKLTLMTALQVLGGFLVLMFFFLLIAIERHQRRISIGLQT